MTPGKSAVGFGITVSTLVLAGVLCGINRRAGAEDIKPITVQTKDGPLVLKPIKHASVLMIFKNKNYYIDPAQLRSGIDYPKADAIFVTHEHDDHCDLAQVMKLRKQGTIVIGSPGSQRKLNMGISMKNGDSRKVLDVTVEAVPAYNIVRTQYHPKGRDNGYVFTAGGKRIYFAGDTEGTPEMKGLKDIDVAFLPINLPFTMPPKDAAEAARAFKPKILVPYHQGSSDPKEVAAALKDTNIRVEVRSLP